MKKLFTLIAIIFSSSLYAQNNLQFSQVKLISSNDTVPAGKVWKVESFIYSSEIVSMSITNSSYDAVDKIFLNGSHVAVRKSSFESYYYYQASSILWEQKVPMWLNAGTTIAPSIGVLYINVMEFNITP